MNKILIGKTIRADRAKIIKLYKSDTDIADLAGRYNVTVNTMCQQLRKWGLKVRKGDYIIKKPQRKHFKRRFSQGLKVRMAYNTQVNNEHMKHIEFKNKTEEQRLVSNIIQHPIIG